MSRKYTTIPYTEYSVAEGNFGYDGRLKIDQIIIHSTVSTAASAIAYFNIPPQKRQNKLPSSAHYVISNTGDLAAMLEEYYVAYHSGNLNVNNKSIGIEHEWYQGMVPSDQLYKKSAQLVADICKYYGLGCNRGVIKGHKEIVPTGCPNQIDVDRIVREAQAILTPPQPVDPCDIRVKAVETQLRGELKALEERLVKEKDKAVRELEAKLNDVLARIDTIVLEKNNQYKTEVLQKVNKIGILSLDIARKADEINQLAEIK